MQKPAVVILVLLLFVPGAQAQAPTSGLRFGDGPEGIVAAAGSAQVLPIVLFLTLSNVACTSSASFRADLSGTATPPANATANATVTVTPGGPFVRFDVPAGAYGNTAGAAGGPYSGRRETSFTVTADGLANETLVLVQFKANLVLPSGDPCRGTGAIPPAQAMFDAKVVFNATDPAGPPPAPKIPMPVGWLFAAALIAVVTLRRRGPA
ncbi:MAG: hypothetical protein HYT80_01360 [Euryarchaeota archaeon]|nr:hypothetical protein [Euryarchaeota archaeon]